jgi:2-oxoglutarate ferredoxin oxidoreductase subunit delta
MAKNALAATKEGAVIELPRRTSAGTATAARPRFLVLVNQAWCKGCGVCMSMCPRHMIVEHGLDKKAVISDHSQCVGCEMCSLHCPEFAIEVLRSEGV